jgi:hypothetical protein
MIFIWTYYDEAYVLHSCNIGITDLMPIVVHLAKSLHVTFHTHWFSSMWTDRKTQR